jgi:hypothetical protein
LIEITYEFTSCFAIALMSPRSTEAMSCPVGVQCPSQLLKRTASWDTVNDDKGGERYGSLTWPLNGRRDEHNEAKVTVERASS